MFISSDQNSDYDDYDWLRLQNTGLTAIYQKVSYKLDNSVCYSKQLILSTNKNY